MSVVNIEIGAYTLSCDICSHEQTVTPSQFGNLIRNKVACNLCRRGRFGRAANPVETMFYRYTVGAEKRGIDFTLSYEEFCSLLTDECYYCGGPGTWRNNHSNTESQRLCGLDRVDSSAAYSVENCVACCKICNRAKSNMTRQEFVEWLDRLVEFRYGTSTREED